jgi:hypothetical protein
VFALRLPVAVVCPEQSTAGITVLGANIAASARPNKGPDKNGEALSLPPAAALPDNPETNAVNPFPVPAAAALPDNPETNAVNPFPVPAVPAFPVRPSPRRGTSFKKPAANTTAAARMG